MNKINSHINNNKVRVSNNNVEVSNNNVGVSNNKKINDKLNNYTQTSTQQIPSSDNIYEPVNFPYNNIHSA